MKYKFYKLVDPRTGHPRYVGRTARSLQTRLAGHLGDYAKNNSPRAQWIQELALYGISPTIELLEESTDDSLEAKWIRRFLNQGFPITNVNERPIIYEEDFTRPPSNWWERLVRWHHIRSYRFGRMKYSNGVVKPVIGDVVRYIDSFDGDFTGKVTGYSFLRGRLFLRVQIDGTERLTVPAQCWLWKPSIMTDLTRSWYGWRFGARFRPAIDSILSLRLRDICPDEARQRGWNLKYI